MGAELLLKLVELGAGVEPRGLLEVADHLPCPRDERGRTAAARPAVGTRVEGAHLGRAAATALLPLGREGKVLEVVGQRGQGRERGQLAVLALDERVAPRV